MLLVYINQSLTIFINHLLTINQPIHLQRLSIPKKAIYSPLLWRGAGGEAFPPKRLFTPLSFGEGLGVRLFILTTMTPEQKHSVIQAILTFISSILCAITASSCML